MIQPTIDGQRVLAQVKTTVGSLSKLETQVQKMGLSVVSEVGAEGRKIAYPLFFSKTYSKTTHSSLNLTTSIYARRYRGVRQGKNGAFKYPERDWKQGRGFTMLTKSGRVDHMGRRLVGFSLENARPDKKVAYFASYPMNLYERNVTVRGHMRPGLYIFTSGRLSSVLESTVPKAVAHFEQKLAEWERTNI